jgi:hypothetical protein
MELLPAPRSIAPSAKLHEWLFGMIQPFVKGRVLETCSTWNSISAVFAKNGLKIHLSNPDKAVRANLRTYYQDVEAIRKVHAVDLHRPDFESDPVHELPKIFDTIIALNAMQNGMYDKLFLQNASRLLRPMGRLILLAPPFTALYEGLELDLNELKKYNHLSLKEAFTGEMQVVKSFYIDLPSDVAYDRSGPSVIVIARKEEKLT